MRRTIPLAVTFSIVAAGVGVATGTLGGDCQVDDAPADAGGAVADGAVSTPPADATPAPAPDAAPAPPPPTGARSVAVRLYPPGPGKRWASFGLPLPPGILRDAAAVRVRAGATEIPAFVKSLGPWRVIPPVDLLCAGNPIGAPGDVRGLLVQLEVDSADPVDVVVDLGAAPAHRLAEGVPVASTMRPVSDGRLYGGSEGVMGPDVIAAVDHRWLACAGLQVAAGLSGVSPELAATDLAQRNFFGTSVKDYRTAWDAPPGSWTVAADYAGVDLKGAENGTWLYQRGSTFLHLYLRTGMVDALREALHALDHYRRLIYTADECAAAGAPTLWCRGFFRLKNPNPTSYYKDIKYSYGEEVASWYWLTGDESALPYLEWISAATKTQGAEKHLDTERFTAAALAAPVFEFEVTGSPVALGYAGQVVDYLAALQATPSSEGAVTGCFPGNDEWGPEGVSPWMTPILMQSLLRYYFATADARVPSMLAEAARCISTRGVAYTSQMKNTKLLMPFYGARNSGPIEDADGGGEGDVFGTRREHSYNVAQGLAIGAVFAAPAARAALEGQIAELIKAAEMNFADWTRATAGLPKFRLSPWRKYNWWFKAAGTLQWERGRPTLP